MKIKKYIYIICEEKSCEHYYFRNFITRNRSEYVLQLKFFPQIQNEDLKGDKDEFVLFERRMETVYRDLDLKENENLWVLINTDQNFDFNKLEITTEKIESNSCRYTISNPNFESWLKFVDESLNCEALKSKNCTEIVLDRDKTKNALTKAKRANCENLGDGHSLPGYGCSTIHELISDLLKLNW